MEIYTKITELLEINKITRSQLAKDIGISEGTIRSWKEGKMPSVDKIISISQYFAIDIYELLGIENKKLSENEKEMLHHFKKLPDREQLKLIGKIEEIAEKYSSAKSLDSKIG